MAGSGSVSTSKEKGGDVVDRRQPEFSMDDLVQEIAGQLGLTDEGMTTKEICEGLGMVSTTGNMAKVSQRIRNLVALGQAEFAGKKESRAIDGSSRSVAAWRLKSGGEGE